MDALNVLILSTPTCIKCRYILPSIKTYLDEKGVNYAIKNALDCRELISELNIQSVPAIIFFKDSPKNPVSTLIGDFTIEDFYTELETLGV